jgi:maltooligosyltrehalose trehalohydrolase
MLADSMWRPSLGAIVDGDRVRVRVWAPTRTQVEIIIDPAGPSPRRYSLARTADGIFTGTFDAFSAGDLYAYVLDGEGPFPDPCSRFQPQGVHGPSAVVDPGSFVWTDQRWRGLSLAEAVFYELHVGTFSESGTFAGAAERLPYLDDLGVSVVELMPVADFPGLRNWGYDGASLFAPSRAYGSPDDLRRLVDRAHALGLAVLLDVVYNHFGPDGAYVLAFSPYYRSPRHDSPWGAAVNLDGEHSLEVRRFFIENALHWVHEYHFDGLRLDATHWLLDDSEPHFLAELAGRVHESVADRTLLLVAEDERNLATIVRRPEEGGWGLDAVWADDFHHEIRRRSAGDRDGYYQDYSGSVADLASTLRRGWFYRGQQSQYTGGPRGTDPSGIPLERMIVCLQNHDQVGNRAFGTRLHQQIDPALFRALSAILLFAPETPLLFMGQEWSASTPFLYFTDHSGELGRRVTEGRRSEFSRFEAFAREEVRTRIPDPQAPGTCESSRLIWQELADPAHAGTLELYRTLIRLRRGEPALRPGGTLQVVELNEHGLSIVRHRASGEKLLLVAWFEGAGTYDHGRDGAAAGLSACRWGTVLTTEEARFREPGASVSAPRVELDGPPVVTFHGPSAVILRAE